MEKVVYVLGAGFSAPLGLPVMSNFLEKAKDMYFANQQDYDYFPGILEEIKKMHFAKSYYNTDLFNIEEILSILEMDQSLSTTRINFKRLIKDVIEYYTPKFNFDGMQINESNWQNLLLGSHSDSWTNYGFFLACVFNLMATATKPFSSDPLCRPQFHKNPNASYHYSIISLNYDLIIEQVCKHVSAYFGSKSNFCLAKTISDISNTAFSMPFAKLHGSIEEKGNIIPPTWNKGLMSEGILEQWKLAVKVLSEANHIRILGYSLPTTDSYVKYLFKAAILHTQNLKSFDVICMDRVGYLEGRYKDFVHFEKFRYRNRDINDYLHQMRSATRMDNGVSFFDQLEARHNIFMGG